MAHQNPELLSQDELVNLSVLAKDDGAAFLVVTATDESMIKTLKDLKTGEIHTEEAVCGAIKADNTYWAEHYEVIHLSRVQTKKSSSRPHLVKYCDWA